MATLWKTPYFFKNLLNSLLQKRDPPITDKSPWGTKSSKYVLFQERGDTLPFIIRKCDRFHPFRHIIYYHENVLDSMRTYKRAHKVNAPYIKQLNQNKRFRGISCFVKFHHLFGIYHMPWRTHELLSGWLDNRSHIVKSCEQF